VVVNPHQLAVFFRVAHGSLVAADQKSYEFGGVKVVHYALYGRANFVWLERFPFVMILTVLISKADKNKEKQGKEKIILLYPVQNSVKKLSVFTISNC